VTRSPQVALLKPRVKAQLVVWAKRAAPDEACGVIVNGKPLRLSNISDEPEAYFLMDDAELLAVYANYGVPEAVWHSHPLGDPLPSTADEDGLPPGMTMLIVAGDEVYEYY
jgi:proteasome lid subunit RPN8/RPN11